MGQSWTFGQKIVAGFAVVVALAILISGVAVYALKAVVDAKDHVIDVNARDLTDAERLRNETVSRSASARGFLLTSEERFVDELNTARARFETILARIKGGVASGEKQRLIERIEHSEREYREAIDRVIALRRTDAPLESVVRTFETDVVPRRTALDAAVSAFAERERGVLEESERESTALASSATAIVGGVAVLATLLALLISWTLARTLTRQIGSAIQHVRSSSTELQSAANQQATSAREQATAMNEITTTISELLATSQQIAESAQRVAHIAEETAKGARSGEQIVTKANEAIAGIKRQVDLIVTHMLDLGKRSQQIGGILEIINELAEQTNILAINASIEAAGAGESGRRFAVVADEIRKLADRVGGSTKEIRGLIDEIRAAVNTTVMTTEGGTKAVDAGARQFSEVTAAFKQIAGLVTTTTEAAREIELSTKQQSTAVAQVNLAVSNVAQATKETEASSSQTYQTATQLTALSQELMRLVQAQANA